MRCSTGLLGLLALAACAVPAEPVIPEFTPNRIDEPAAERFSLSKAIGFMDAAARMWNSKYSCVTCHTNGLYLAARARASTTAPVYAETRAFARRYLERFVIDGERPKGRVGEVEGIVATTSFLVMSDMAANGRLDAATTRGLDHMFAAQSSTGSWSGWLKCRWPPYEIDDHFGVTLAALALGHAPRSYRQTQTGRAGLRRVLSYLRANPASNPHQKGMTLWAAARLEGVVDAATATRWRDDLHGLQREDGGWRLLDLGDANWVLREGARSVQTSDAYATGFAIFVLRQCGVPAADARLRRGLSWLRNNQRQSGRWFVRSPRRDGKHFISHAATQFAVLAFLACGEPVPELGERR